MNEVVIYSPTEIWALFQREKQRLKSEMKMIAKNPAFNVIVYLTSEDRGLTSYPNIIVYLDDDEIYSEVSVSQRDCEQTAKKVYGEYLSEGRLINHIIEKDANKVNTNDALDQELEIDSREEELDEATRQFLHDVLGGPLDDFVNDDIDEIYEDCKDHFLEYIARKWDISIYRPMILEDETTGEEFFEEYPYECMDYEDEDNPIYK